MRERLIRQKEGGVTHSWVGQRFIKKMLRGLRERWGGKSFEIKAGKDETGRDGTVLQERNL